MNALFARWQSYVYFTGSKEIKLFGLIFTPNGCYGCRYIEFDIKKIKWRDKYQAGRLRILYMEWRQLELNSYLLLLNPTYKNVRAYWKLSENFCKILSIGVFENYFWIRESIQ